MSRAPHVLYPVGGFRPGEDQRRSVSVLRAPCQPAPRFPPVWRIAPHSTLPRFQQPVIPPCVVPRCHLPRSLDRRTRIKVERPECSDDLRRREPFILLAPGGLVGAHASDSRTNHGRQPDGRAGFVEKIQVILHRWSGASVRRSAERMAPPNLGMVAIARTISAFRVPYIALDGPPSHGVSSIHHSTRANPVSTDKFGYRQFL